MAPEAEQSAEPGAQKDAGPAPRRRLLFRLIALVLALAIGLVIIELTLSLTRTHVRISNSYRDGGIFVPYKPGSEAELLNPEFRVTYRINQFGFRDEPRQLAKKDGVKRVLILGDSFAEGWGVEQDQSFPALVDKALPAEVWNTAKAGGGTIQYIFQARYHIPRFKPDLVVVQIFDNDASDNAGMTGRCQWTDDGRLGPIPEELLPEEGALAGLKAWWDEREIKRRLKLLNRRLNDKPIYTPSHHRVGAQPDHEVYDREEAIARAKINPYIADWVDDEGTEAIVGFHAAEPDKKWIGRLKQEQRLLEQLVDEVRAAGVSIAFVYIPDRRIFVDQRMLRDLAGTNLHYRLIATVCAQKKVPWLNLQEHFVKIPDPVRLYYAVDGHLNPDGHAITARLVAPLIDAVLKGQGPK